MQLTNFSIRRPVFTIVAMLLFLLLGFISLFNIPLTLIPEIDPPIGAVVTSYPNAGPEEVVDRVTTPLEDQLSTLSGLNTISSTSMEGSSMILLEFSWATSISEIENEVISRINQTPLPEGGDQPRFLTFDPSQLPIIQLSLAMGEEVTDFQELVTDLERELVKIDGVANIDTSGRIVEHIRVQLDQEQLETFQLAQEDIVSLIQSHHITLPGGTVQSGDHRLTTRVMSTLEGTEDIRSLVVAIDPETYEEITVADVGTVEIVPEEIRSISRTNQEPSLLLSVQQQADANTAAVSSEFNQRLDELLHTSRYRELDVAVLFDQGEFIEEAIGNVSTALLFGGLFAMLVLFLFLRNLRSPLIIGIAIPFSVIVTFVLLYFSNFSLNIMTLGGLALGIGMLVDNSIVVIENIYRHLSMGKEPKHAARDGAKEVAAAITASTLTTVSVFLPVVFITGIIGNLFREFALTVSFSLFASLVVALTVVPMIVSRVLTSPKENVEERRRTSPFLVAVERSVRWSLRHRIAVVAITGGLLVLGAFGLTTVGTEFLPASDEGFFTVDLEMERGTPLQDTFTVVEDIEAVLAGRQEIQDYLTVTGSEGAEASLFGISGSHQAQVHVSMVPVRERNQSTVEFAQSIRRDLERAAGEADLSLNLQASFGGSPNTLTFYVSDVEKDRLDEAVEDLYAELSGLSDVEEIRSDRTDTTNEIQIVVDPDAARAEGFVPAQIAQVVGDVTRGVTATQLVVPDDGIYEVTVRYDESVLDDIESLGNLRLRKQDGTFASLADVTVIEEGEGPATINRVAQEDAVEFHLQFGTTTSLGEFTATVRDHIDGMQLDENTVIAFTGDQQLLEDATSDLSLALVAAVVFVYLVMAAQFESFKYPLVIMFSVPLVLIGVAIGLTITQTPISVTALIGLIVLAGIVVNNSIVLVDYINQKKGSGLDSLEAIVEAVKDRIRPILMTATTTILGLVPLALGIGEGTEIQQPLGITVIAGLISSTLLTLFVIPVVYSLFDKRTRRRNKKVVTADGQTISVYQLRKQESGKDAYQWIEGELYEEAQLPPRSHRKRSSFAENIHHKVNGKGDEQGVQVKEEMDLTSVPYAKSDEKQMPIKDRTKEELIELLGEIVENYRRKEQRDQ
ncbi:efflux RND transporter permease subunit [Desertibacillus haloalkaliphilus]|uniref:efflux RND transporter permease subunit n=1 Tax=Desertibacillus haloalkaliphilus TaxID=1328930 RepID=UPI001C2599A1|nr:efflux RND transporter permease subunit [Desertibacillus haloalkaliphilus]MBU8904996.1 efflux RND transporter permease subunit [Desertibacillus haloalkaliphilus]